MNIRIELNPLDKTRFKLRVDGVVELTENAFERFPNYIVVEKILKRLGENPVIIEPTFVDSVFQDEASLNEFVEGVQGRTNWVPYYDPSTVMYGYYEIISGKRAIMSARLLDRERLDSPNLEWRKEFCKRINQLNELRNP